MSRILTAFSAFFTLLFAGRLPRRALPYLPTATPETQSPEPEEHTPAAKAGSASFPAAASPRTAPRRPPPSPDEATLRTEGALALLALLQREGRLLDFLRESLDTYDDAAIGVAVRDIHRDCRKALDSHIKIEPVMPGREDEAVSVPRGFDPAEVRVIGNALGEPPWKGVLLHHGWRVVDTKLPTLAGEVDRHIIAPAEVKLA